MFEFAKPRMLRLDTEREAVPFRTRMKQVWTESFRLFGHGECHLCSVKRLDVTVAYGVETW